MAGNSGAPTSQAVKDVFAYPVLTEEVGYPPSPLSAPRATPAGGNGSDLGQIVNKALSDVLGWKAKAGDSKGFVGALQASFTSTEVDGSTDWTWTPRTYAVQTDLAGGISGAQASLYTRAQDALTKSLPLLDGLYSINPDSDPEDVDALKELARSQLTELVNELAFPGGPRKSRVNQYFGLLLLPDGGVFPPLSVTDPDKIDGTLGRLRDVLGLNFQYQDFVNTVDDEQDLSNFRILSDYVTSLAQSWINNLDFFGLEPQKAFFGTQLVLLSRQLSVVAESVDEVRFTLDSVFLGPAERQTIMLPDLPDGPMFLEDLLSWVQNFASEEGPRLIQDGGKFGVSNSVQPIAQRLKKLISATSNLSNGKPRQGIPPGFFQPRVAVALSVLDNQLGDLIKLAGGIQHQIPSVQTLPFELYAVSPNSVSLKSGIVTIQVFGQGFQVGDRKASRRPNVVPDVTVVSGGKTLNVAQRFFVSSNHLIVQLSTAGATSGSIYDVKVTNPDSKAATLTGGLTVTS